MAMQFKPLSPRIVLAIGAHPDDMDFSSGGSLAHFAKQGAAIHYLQLTDGGSGSEDESITSQQLAQLREQEQQAASDIIGGQGITFLRYTDGTLENSLPLRRDIVKVIRTIKPDVVVTMDPTMVYVAQLGIINHPDHRAAGQATLDAVYPLARDHLSFPELAEQGFAPHKVTTVLLNNFTKHNFYINIGDTLETKLRMVKAHASQTSNYQAMAERFTSMAATMGGHAGCAYAEGYIRLDVRA